jgi:CO/xanthine dehydrogenase Mo-binding subunit
VLIIETQDAVGPYGARGLGEHGIVAVPPAVANALSKAIGVDFFEIPITPEDIMDALESRRTVTSQSSRWDADDHR